MECISLIDFSLEDDFLIPSSSQGLENYDLFNIQGSEALSALEVANIERASKLIEQVSELTESPRQRLGLDRHTLRKSLAWDSEFFTSEGVLNSEELAIFNSTYSKAAGISLPGIHEELTKSAESTSASLSESQALENLKHSIQRPLIGSVRTADMGHFGKLKEHKSNIPNPKTLKKLDFSSQSKLKPPTPTALSKHRTSRQLQKNIINGGSADAKRNASGTGQAITRAFNKPLEILSTSCSLTGLGKKSSVVNKPLKINGTKDLPEILTSKRQTSLSFNKANKDPRVASFSTPSKYSILSTPRSGFKLAAGLCSSSSYSVPKTVAKNTTHCSPSLSAKTSDRATSKLLLSKSSPASSIDSFISESSSQASSSTKHCRSFKISIGNDPSKKSGSLTQPFIGRHSKMSSSFDTDAKGATSFGLRTPRPRVGYFDKEAIVAHGYNSERGHIPAIKVTQLPCCEGNSKGNSIGYPIRKGSKVPSNLLQPKYEQRVNEQALLMKARAILSTEKENMYPTNEGAL